MAVRKGERWRVGIVRARGLLLEKWLRQKLMVVGMNEGVVKDVRRRVQRATIGSMLGCKTETLNRMNTRLHVLGCWHR